MSLVGVAATLGGCYGSTEPATDVGSGSARLNAQGTANDGPAYSYFEYDTALPTGVSRTRLRAWPAGASGRVSEVVGGLREATAYAYRVCGGDQGEPPACAQYRFFTTRGPDGKDSVKGWWRYTVQGVSNPEGQIDAVSGPSGENPSGSLSHYRTEQFEGALYPVRFTGFVTCVAVDGSRATVGAVGTEHFGRTDTTRRATSLFTVEDLNGTFEDQDRLRAETAAGTTPPSCAAGLGDLDEPIISFVVATDN